jgi:outer membrane PBP1 activator LpoA protein
MQASPTPTTPAIPAPAPVAPLPARLGFLLPLSGRLADAGEAVRDGFLAAYFGLDPTLRPEVRFHDAASDPVAAYRAAQADGAGFIVGPLDKENVQAVARVADGSLPVLALNFLPDGDAVPPRFFQFALAPEDEARQVAERLLAEGRRTGVALAATGEWGARVLAAFQAALAAGGGTLVATRPLTSGTMDYTEALTTLLGFEESERRYRAISAITGPLQFTPRRREDLQFVFLAGQPTHGRLIRPQLKFHYAGDLPVYATADIYEPNPIANQDLDGVAFTDMPWMLADDPATTGLRNAAHELWPADARHRGRLYAMGYDSLRLVGLLAGAGGSGAEPLAGLTGRLSVDRGGRVRRGLDFAVFGGDGQIRPLGPPEADH